MPRGSNGALTAAVLACRGWITLSSLTNNLKNQNLAQTYHMDVLNGVAFSPCFTSLMPLFLSLCRYPNCISQTPSPNNWG